MAGVSIRGFSLHTDTGRGKDEEQRRVYLSWEGGGELPWNRQWALGGEQCISLNLCTTSRVTGSRKLRAQSRQQRTGMPSFMVYKLLGGSDVLHLYRHDLESLFYVMLILATHYEIQPPTKKEGGRDWKSYLMNSGSVNQHTQLLLTTSTVSF